MGVALDHQTYPLVNWKEVEETVAAAEGIKTTVRTQLNTMLA